MVAYASQRHFDFVPLKWHDLARALRSIVGTNFMPVSGLLYTDLLIPAVAGMIYYWV